MKIIRYLDKNFEKIILVILLLLMACILMTQVIMRFIFKHALSWAEEISVQLYIISVFFSIAYCIRNKSMLRVEIIEGLMPERIRRILHSVSELVNVIIWGYLFYASFDVIDGLIKSKASLPATLIPHFYMYEIYRIALAVAVVRSLEMFIKYTFSDKEGK